MSVAPIAPALPHLPVAGAYARLAEVFPAVRLTEAAPRSGDGWITAADLAGGGGALDAYLVREDAQIREEQGRTARPDVTAGFGLHRYAWSACLLITVPWFLLRRVPRLPVTDVAHHRDLSLTSARVREFACLPDDPAAVLPGARVVGGEDELRAEVRGALAEHLEPLLTAFRPRMRRGPRALWGMATDEIVEGLWYAGHLLGEEARAIAELETLLPGAVPPFAAGPGFRELTGPSGQKLPTRDRASCCMYYTLRPEDTCVTCPRTCDAERVTRLAGN
ncbi:(2Fe-2S)-binding protein [Streptomyces zingiberis]|uniref:(2Fe-2S)-binding protein n=1 Tax=Streptomyces zingiberis TaxID=2053010 RepID=A0ABX1C1S1_9ACTN|nr:(2Fe-2S)-binding protein [Streptomyces zingiberis]NJQ03840.1 (2Fe-2S)-binding protein [Streptomyces zingiberis]